MSITQTSFIPSSKARFGSTTNESLLKSRQGTTVDNVMLNKFAVFSVVTVVGLFNIGIYVLFIQPSGFGPQVSSLMSFNTLALVLPPGANGSLSTLNRPSTHENPVTNSQQQQQRGGTAHPMHVKFLDRTLMQSPVNVADNMTDITGRNATFKASTSSSSSSSSAGSAAASSSSSSAGDVSDEATKVRCPSGTGACSHQLRTPSSTESLKSGGVSLPATLTPLGPPPMLTTQPESKKPKGKTKTKAPHLSTVVPPPMPRTDTHNYTYIINRPDVCSPPSEKTGNDHQVLLLVFVCAAPANFGRRQAIRDTWGSVALNQSLGVRLLFLLGYTANRTIQKGIEEESALHADIIQEDFLDTYNNLTIKSVMLLKWVDHFCPRVKFVLKTDDDSFINLRNLVKYLGFVKKRKRMLFGRLVRGARPVRLRTSKWFAPLATFRERVYPDYLSGSAYAMSGDVAHSLYNVSLRTPLFHLEDVFITGLCARKTGVARRHHSGFTYDRRAATGCAFRNAISGHRVTSEDMYKIWDELSSKNLTACR